MLYATCYKITVFQCGTVLNNLLTVTVRFALFTHKRNEIDIYIKIDGIEYDYRTVVCFGLVLAFVGSPKYDGR